MRVLALSGKRLPGNIGLRLFVALSMRFRQARQFQYVRSGHDELWALAAYLPSRGDYVREFCLNDGQLN